MRRVCAVAFAVGAAVAVPLTAAADKPPKKHKGHGRDGDVHVTVTFHPDERERVRLFFVESYGRGKCPPGLAKKNNGCLPPGQAKKRYAVGRPLPRGVVMVPLPVDLGRRIGPPPDGYRYGIVDGDLVKLAVGTLLVVDAIQGFVD
jgi:hypothetical protein